MILQHKPPVKVEFIIALLTIKICSKKGNEQATNRMYELANDFNIDKVLNETSDSLTNSFGLELSSDILLASHRIYNPK